MRPSDQPAKTAGPAFWKIAGAGAAFQAGSSAVDSVTIVASLVLHLTGSVFAVGAASAVLRLGWLLPQLVVGFLAQQAERRMPFYVVGAFGRAACLALIAGLLAVAAEPASAWISGGFLASWTLYAFVSGIVAVPYNDIVGRSISASASEAACSRGGSWAAECLPWGSPRSCTVCWPPRRPLPLTR